MPKTKFVSPSLKVINARCRPHSMRVEWISAERGDAPRNGNQDQVKRISARRDGLREGGGKGQVAEQE